MNVAIICNRHKDPNLEYTRKAIRLLKEAGMTVLLRQSDFEGTNFLAEDGRFVSESDLFSMGDVIVTMGGDGTILRVAPSAAQYGTPILGVNLGRLGYLAQLEKQDVDKIVSVLRQKKNVEQRIMLQVAVYRGENKIFESAALNDVTLNRQNDSQAVLADLLDNDEPVYNYQSDGLIFATPTGSTAYSLSAGGPIIDPSSQNIIEVSPICEHSLFSRTLIFGTTSVLSCVIANPLGETVKFCVDGKKEIDLLPQDKIIIQKAERTVPMLKVSSGHFYTVLNQKFSGRGK